jgi:hypothetical protein
MSHAIKLLGTAAVCALAGTVYAGNDFPPPWANWQQTGGLTHWHWDFANGPTAPPTGSGPGLPQLTLTGNAFYSPTGPGGHGGIVLPGGSAIDILVPNYNIPTHIKLIWVQTDYIGGPEPEVSASFGAFNGDHWGPTVTPGPSPDGLGLVSGAGWQLPFCPPFEIVHIANPHPGTTTFIRWLTIDTICIPTPAGAAVLGLGSLAAVRRRR